MPQFMYEASVPMFVRFLTGLSAILDKAAKYAEAKKIDPTILANTCLAPDMFPLTRQVQIASDIAKGCAARLSGIEVPSYADDETTFPELQARIKKAVAFIQSTNKDEINKSEERDITIKIANKEMHFKGQDYLNNFVLPNFYFHITIVYAILRHHGLELGKNDYLGMK
jgi:hypothetical protein